MLTADRKLRVFLCHARGDKGWLDVWLDEIKLLPGQEWDIEVEKAVEQG